MDRLRIGFVMDPIETIKPKKDTTLAMMIEAQERGFEVFYFTLADLSLRDEVAFGSAHAVRVKHDLTAWFEIIETQQIPLHDLDVIVMRKDPPFDMEYIASTYILEAAVRGGVKVVNDPRSLRDANEKLFTALFPQCCPPTLVTRNKSDIREFLHLHGSIVLKPIGKMGGRSVFVIQRDDLNANVIIEELTQDGSIYVQAQRYLPAITSSGDKRILLVNGVPIGGALARIPSANDHRGNLAAGARAEGVPFSERDLWICEQLRPELQARGLTFVGIDVIGDHLTEINVTSPTGVREIDHFFGCHIASDFLDAVCQNLR